jgi:hypothetical protein
VLRDESLGGELSVQRRIIMQKVKASAGRSFLFVLVTAMMGASCGDQSSDVTCADYFKTADSVLVDKGNGVVQDTTTDLQWYRCNAGQNYVNGECKNEALNLNFDATANAVQEISTKQTPQATEISWRMPTQNEYASLTDVPCNSPMIDVTAFPAAQSETFYWSSSEGKNDDFACGTRFADGRQLCQISKSSVNPTMLVSGGD